MDTTAEDLKILRSAGGLGHAFAGVGGQPGERRLLMEAGDPRRIGEAMEGLNSLTIYARRGSDWHAIGAEAPVRSSPILSGQVITPRHPRRRPALLALGLVLTTAVPTGLVLGAFALGTRFRAHSAPSWPPAKVKLIPAIPEPQGTVLAYLETDQNWIVSVVWEPARPGRFLGVEKVEDADACRLHVAAEAKYDEQLRAIQAGTAKCFAETFTREPADD